VIDAACRVEYHPRNNTAPSGRIWDLPKSIMNAATLLEIWHSGEWVGWVATALFALSYLVDRPLHLLLLQALAGALWVIYGAVLGAAPVVVDNGVVAAGALYKAQDTWRKRRRR